MSQELRILFLADSPDDAELVSKELQKGGINCSLKRVGTVAEFSSALKESTPDAVLSADHSLPALPILLDQNPDVPFIALSGTVDEDQAVELIKRGATDYVSKQRLSKLVPALQRALRETQRRSEQRKAEEFLRESETRFRAVFEGAGTGIAVENLSGRILETNRALQQMLGYSAEELQHITRQDFSHAQDHQEDAEHFQRLLSGELSHYQKEKRFVRKDGRIIWGRLTISMIRDVTGAPQFPIIMIEDITERQRAEEALGQNAAIVESSNDAIVSMTFDGIIFSWNPAAERLYGYTAAEANGRSASIIIPPEKEAQHAEHLQRIRRGDRVDNLETLRLRKNGTRIHAAVTMSPIKDVAGRILGVSSIARDITERKRAEEALRESEENYRRLVELAPNGILIQSEGKYIYVNDAGMKLFGASSTDQIVGRSVLELVHPDFIGTAQDRLQLIASGQEAPLRELKLTRVDGAAVDAEAIAIPFVYRGKPASLVMVRDITQRKRAEEALRKSEARLAQAQQIAHLGSWDQDMRTGVLTWSDETCRIFGVEPGRFEGHYAAFEHFVHPDDVAPLRAAASVALAGGKYYHIDHRIILANGEIKTVSEQAEVVFDENKQPIRFVGTVLDITGRKKAEERIAALSNLGQRLSSATTAKEAAEIIVDVAGQLLGWDCCSLDLCSPDQKIFNTVLSRDLINGVRVDIPFPYVNAPPSPRLRQVLEKGAVLILRHEPVVPADEYDPIGDVSRPSASLLFVPVRNGPKIIGVLSIRSYSAKAYGQDDLNTLQALADHCGGALERIRAEAEKQKLAAFPEFNPNPVLEFAGDGTVNYFNDAAHQMANSLGREHPLEFLPPDVADIVRRCVATGQSSLRIERMVQNRVISSSFFPVPAIGVVHCYAGDITERQNLEAQLRQSQKMESVGQLAGGIAHDFNNILTVIQGHTSLLSMIPNLPTSAEESAQQIGLAAERAANLTRQLLTFSRRQIIQPKCLDLNEVVNNMTKMLRRLLGEDITLQVNYAAGLPLVLADPGMMEQVLLNLSVNARDAMPKGGRLFVNTSVVSIDADYVKQTPEAKEGEYVCVAVKDTGMGIAPEDLPHIFEPFFTTKDVGKGTGLGLATVYGIVRQHHGWVKVTSNVGRETAFQIFLPAARTQPEPAEAKPVQTNVRGGNETVLVVEDETPLRILVRNVLDRYGYRVLEAGSGVAALSIWRQEKDKISLLLTDMVMPHGMSGRELADRLLSEKPNLKVIYSSGYSLAVVGTDMVLREGTNFLQKPYHPRKLAQAVRDCLDT